MHILHIELLCVFSCALLSEGENWVDMQKVPSQARKIKLWSQNCLKAECSAQKNKIPKNNLVSKLISVLQIHAELGASKPAVRAGEGLLQLCLLNPQAQNTDFARRNIKLQPHGLLTMGIFPWRSWWVILFARETITRHYFLFVFSELQNWKGKASIGKKTHRFIISSRLQFKDCVLNMLVWSGRKTTIKFWTLTIFSWIWKYYKNNFRLRNADWGNKKQMTPELHGLKSGLWSWDSFCTLHLIVMQ